MDAVIKKRWQALGVISIIQLVLLLDATVVNVALPQIKHDLGLTDGSLTWIVNAYLITAGSLLLLGGRIGDAYGVLRTFQVGIVIFGGSSFVATIAPNATTLIIGRAGQGIGEALASSTGLAMISLLFPSGPDRSKAFSIWAALGGLGSILGVLLSGVITEQLSWRWVFGINIPIILILAIATILVIPKLSNQISTRLDLSNALILAVSVCITVLGVIGSGIEQLLWLRIMLILLGISGVALVLRRCKYSEDSIIPARLMTSSPRLTGYAILAIQAGTSGAVFYLGVLLLQDYIGMTPLQAGLAWLPFCFGFFPGIFLSQFVTQRWSTQTAAVVGLFISAFGFILFAIGVPMQNYWVGMMPAMLVTSIGFGCVAPVAQSLATTGLSESDAGAGSGIATTIQQLFQVGGMTFLVAVAINFTDGVGVSTIESNGFIVAFAVSAMIFIGGAIFIGLRRSALVLDTENTEIKH
ncbi:MFS transporter [Xenorhabdus sp. 12]|uniref:MFS transporter n=1 Tax=Xenorhabdus santafensis TaxID=2582833 RepID=A0ABU4SDP7_9GAMM|nr:MFS transporter [Xenorhabdus sp. 12]MDX7988918.1 MFS transporter [Xenorhabdus sp. 12]